MRTRPHHFQSMERAAAWYPTRATPTFSRFHSQLSITDVSDPVSTLQHICIALDKMADEQTLRWMHIIDRQTASQAASQTAIQMASNTETYS